MLWMIWLKLILYAATLIFLITWFATGRRNKVLLGCGGGCILLASLLQILGG
jgi:hypothetical protein